MVKVKSAIQKIKIRMKEEFKHVSWILLSVGLIVYGLRENVNLFIGVAKLKSHEQEYEGKHLSLHDYLYTFYYQRWSRCCSPE